MYIDLSNTITGNLSRRVKKRTRHDRHWSNLKNLKDFCQVLEIIFTTSLFILKTVFTFPLTKAVI